MSRIHEALRKAGTDSPSTRSAKRNPVRPPVDTPPSAAAEIGPDGGTALLVDGAEADPPPAAGTETIEDFESAIQNAVAIAYKPNTDALLVDPTKPREAPAEEFRALRTRLNHLQSIQPLRTLVVTSASPAEGKSFTATNLAITQSQLADKRIVLADFDFRRPTLDKTFQIDCSPGITDYLKGTASFSQILRRVADTNLYVITAGGAVPNPLELLNLKECRSLIDGLRENFDWVILDSPPLLFAADGNLLATMCDGTILVVRIGSTTFDSVTRALQSLCENNVLGIVVNGARRGELYSKYSYYHDYYYERDKEVSADGETVPVQPASSQPKLD